MSHKSCWLISIMNPSQVHYAGTHDGPFHADDVLSAAILRLINPRIEFVRTRDQKVLDELKLIFDVGRKLDPGTGRFDHHQDPGLKRSTGAALASAGLIWCHFGQIAIEQSMVDLMGAEVHEVWWEVDKSMIQKIDCLDVGGGMPGDGLTMTQITAMVNPVWDGDQSPESFDSRFDNALSMMIPTLRLAIHCGAADVRAKSAMRDVIGRHDPDDRVLVMDRYIPWQSAMDGAPGLLYVVFPAAGGTGWNVQAIPGESGPFSQRRPLPRPWGEASSREELASITGVDDVIFCHAGLFIAGAASREGAIALARRAVAYTILR